MKPVAAESDWLRTTVTTVRDLMIRRIGADTVDSEARRELQMALEELDVMWEELQGQAEQLNRENARYAEFFEFAPDAYVITDVGGNVREANQAAAELFAAARGDLVGRPLGNCIPEDERAAFLAHWVGLIVGGPGKSACWTGRVRAAGGDALAVQFSLRGIPLKKSGVGGLCWLIRPVA